MSDDDYLDEAFEKGFRLGRKEALEEAIYTLQKMPYEYLDGPSLHVETMTIGRAVIAITKLKEEKKND